MVMFLLSFVKGSKSAEGGKNPLADMEPGGPYRRTGCLATGRETTQTNPRQD